MLYVIWNYHDLRNNFEKKIIFLLFFVYNFNHPQFNKKRNSFVPKLAPCIENVHWKTPAQVMSNQNIVVTDFEADIIWFWFIWWTLKMVVGYQFSWMEVVKCLAFKYTIVTIRATNNKILIEQFIVSHIIIYYFFQINTRCNDHIVNSNQEQYSTNLLFLPEKTNTRLF